MQCPGNCVLANKGWSMDSNTYVSKPCRNNRNMNYLCILCIDVNEELVLTKRCFWIVWPHLHFAKCKGTATYLKSGIIICWRVMPSLYMPASHIKITRLHSPCCCYNNRNNTYNNLAQCSWAVIVTVIIIKMRKQIQMYITDSNDADYNNNNNKTMQCNCSRLRMATHFNSTYVNLQFHSFQHGQTCSREILPTPLWPRLGMACNWTPSLGSPPALLVGLS